MPHTMNTRAHSRWIAIAVTHVVASFPGMLLAQTVTQLSGVDRPLTAQAQELYSVGSMAGEEWETFSGVAGVAFDAQGNLYVLDRQNFRVVKVDPQGRFLMEMGREGDGPGEFGMPMALSVSREGEVRVFDLGKRGFAVFNPDGSFRATVPMKVGEEFLPTGEFLPHPGGGLIHGTTDGGTVSISSGGGADGEVRRISLLELAGEVERTVVHEAWDPAAVAQTGRTQTTTAGPVRLTGPPMRAFDPDLLAGVLPDGRLAVVDSTTYEVKLVDMDRGEVQRLQRPFPPRRVTRRDREAEKERRLEEVARRAASDRGGSFYTTGGEESRTGRIPSSGITAMMEALIESMEFGEEIPVIAGLSADWEGRLWVERTGARVGEKGAVDILTGDGRYLGTLPPGSFDIPEVFGPEGLAAWVERDELDVPQVVVKRVTVGRAG